MDAKNMFLKIDCQVINHKETKSRIRSRNLKAK